MKLLTFAMLVNVTLVMQFGTLRYEPFSSFLSASFDNSTTTLGLHSCTKSVLTLTTTFRRLIGAFHFNKGLKYPSVDKKLLGKKGRISYFFYKVSQGHCCRIYRDYAD